MGVTGGAASHPHTHSIDGHSHSLADGNPTGIARITLNSGKVYQQKVNGVNGWTSDTNNDTGATNSVNNGGMTSGTALAGNTKTGGSGNTGSDSTSALPPYLNVAYIIKT
jgi:hypothetical protein